MKYLYHSTGFKEHTDLCEYLEEMSGRDWELVAIVYDDTTNSYVAFIRKSEELLHRKKEDYSGTPFGGEDRKLGIFGEGMFG